MSQSSREEIIKVLLYLAALSPHFKLTDASIAAYYDQLSDLPYAELAIAAKHLGSQDKWFPSAAEIRKTVLSLGSRGLPIAAQAWGEVKRKIGEDGYIRTPEFSDPMIQETVEGLGGWAYLCHSEDEMVDRAHFIKMFDQIRTRKQESITMLPEVREAIEQLTDGMKMLKGGTDARDDKNEGSADAHRQKPAKGMGGRVSCEKATLL